MSQTILFIEQHHVAVSAIISQQLATSKTMQMLLTMMPSEENARWGLTLAEAHLVKSVLADMKPVNQAVITWFNSQATKQDWVLKNQGEGGGHCIFGEDISENLQQLKPVTELGELGELAGYARYLIRSKPANENEGGVHSGQGILDSLVLVN